MLRVEIASILLVIWRASTLAAQTAKPLSSRDLSLAAMPDRADSSVVRRVLGTPDSIANGDDPSEAAPIPAWWYQDLEVIFLHGHELHGWWLTGPSRTTARGLRVGASRAVVRRLYGAPTNAYGDSILVYCEPHRPPLPRCMSLWLAGGRVQRIYIGRSID
jgi:hypothetical protein